MFNKDQDVSSNHSKKRVSFPKFISAFLDHQNQGFSLAEIMVAAGMLGVLSLGVSQLMQNSAKTEKRLSQQVNLITLDSQIMDALLDTTACERTFGITGGANPNAVTGASWTALPTNAIYRGNNPEVGNNAARWNTVVTAYDGTSGIYGSGSNTVYVKAIEYAGFLKAGVDNKFNDLAGSYDAASFSNIPGTTDSYGTVVLHVDFRRGNPASYEALADDAARAEKAKRSLYGSYKVPRYYKVNVRVNAANNIVGCYAYSEIMSDTYCSLFDGYLDPATGRCTNIKIRTSPIEPTANQWALTAFKADGINGNSLIQGGLRIGGELVDVPPEEGDLLVTRHNQIDGNLSIGDTSGVGPGTADDLVPTVADPASTGNAGIEKNLIVGQDAQVNQQLISVEEALFQGKVNMGPLNMEGGNYLLKVTQESNTEVVHFTSNSVSEASEVKINEVIDSNGKIEFNHSNSEPFRILEGTALAFRVNQNGRVDFYNGNGGGTNTATVRNSGRIDLFDGTGDASSDAVTIIGDGNLGDSYRPIRVKNQDTSIPGMRIPNTTVGEELTTKQWVKTMIYGSGVYDDDDIQTILNNISQYAQHHPKDALSEWTCGKMRLHRSSKNDTNCIWESGVCSCYPVNCSDYGLSAADREVCSNIYLSGQIHAEFATVRQNLSAGGNINAGGNIVTEDGTVRGEYVMGDDFVRGRKFFTNYNGITGAATGAGWIYGDRLQAKSRTCVDGAGCYTRFGKFMCPWQQVMVGIAYGQPICTTVGP